MNRAAAVGIAFLVLVSSVVPVSAVSGTAEPSVDADVGALGDLGSRSDLDQGSSSPTSDVGTASSPASVSTTTGNSSSDRLGNTGFEPHYYYVEGLANVANGNLYVTATDASFGTLGTDIELQRSYNSLRSGEHGPFGFGWTHSYDVHLVERDDGTVVLSDADGSTHTFTSDNGGYTAPAGVHARLRGTGSGFALDYLSGKTYRFDADGTLTSIEDRNGNRLDLSYTGDRLTTVSDESGQTLELTYTAEGRIATATDPLGRTVEYRYETGDLVAVVDPAGRTTRYAYYANHKLERIVRPSGLTRLFSYDAADRVDCLELGFQGVSSDNSPDCNGFSLGYDLANGSATVTSVPTSETTALALDDAGSPVRVTTARGEVTFDWDADRNLAAMTNSSGTTTFEYDAYGNLLSRTDALGNDVHQQWRIVETSDRYLALRASRTDERGATTTYGYDDSGNLVSVTNPLGDTRTLGYDADGNRVNETDFGGHETTYTFDSHGFLASATDPEGATTAFDIDRAGRIVNVTGPRGNSYRYTYDVLDQVVRITDPLGNETLVEYDEDGRVANVTTAAGRVISPEFRIRDDGGQVRTDSRGNIDGITTDEHAIDRQFDTLNRLTSETIDLGPTSVDVEYEYDAAGNLVSRTVAGETTTYEYDALGRVTNVTGPASGWVSYTYDAAGRRTRATYSNGVTTHYEYDAAGNLVHLHGERENWTTVTTASTSTMATTNGTATPSATTSPTTTVSSTATATATPAPTTTSSPDTATPKPSPSPTPTPSSTTASTSGSTLVTTATSTAGNETLFEYTYTYDASGNRLTETDGAGRTTRYEYDAMDRLVGVESPNGETVSYTYDAVGNRLTRTVNGTDVTGYSYRFDDAIRNAGSTTYGHDDGNRASMQDGSGTTRYGYGPDGRLANVTLPDGRNVSYTYLPTGERLSRTTENGTTYYLYSDFDPVGTVADNGTIDRRYVQAPRVDEMLSLSEGDERYFYHYDPSGNVRFVTDENGSVANTYEYDAFGTLRRTEETVENPYRFAGRPQDTETGLYYNRLRYYDPETGRFTREDPARLAAGVNFYTYAENNPVRYRDPTGLAATSVWTGACSGGGGMAVVVGADISSCVLTNLKTGQTCSVSVYAFKFGGGLGIGGGAQVNLQTGAECGGGLQGGSFSAFGEWNAGCLGGSVDVNTDSPGVGTSQGPGTDCGAGLAGGGKYTHMEVNSCSCECSCGQFCDSGECDDDDDRPPGGDHPDDNHDLSVLGYDSVYPDFEYDRGSRIAVLDRGFVTEIEDFFAAKELSAASVDVRTSEEELGHYDVLVVPTGGLLGLNSLTSFETKLETYVRNGGTLVVLPQQRGYEFGPVPGELKGYGWLEDQSCQYDSIGLTNSCAVVSSLDEETASVNVDGYFTDWPENATILLSRTVNGQPAMLSYDRGEGRVLATTVYTDWAFGHHAASDEGERLLRNVLAWATSPPDVPVYRAGETVTHDLKATNYVELTADEVRVDLRSPDGTVHSVPAVRSPVAGFSNRTVNVTYDLPATTDYGIWRVGYTLLNDSYGEIERVEDADSLSVSRFTAGDSLYRSENVTFAVSSDAERYANGANATFRITIRNSGTENETVTAWWAFPHNHRGPAYDRLYGASTTKPGEHRSALNRTVTVPAGGETTIVHEVPVYSYDRLWAQFYRGDQNSTDYLGRTSRAFYSFSPTVDVAVDTNRTEYRLGERVGVSLSLDGPAGYATTDLRAVGPESTLVYEDEVLTPLGGNGSTNVSSTFDLPTDAPPGYYTVVADTEIDGVKVGFDSSQFFVPDARIRAVPEIPAAVANGSSVGFTLINVGREGSVTGVDVSLVAPDGSTVWNDSTTADVHAEDRNTVAFDLETGPRQFGQYRLVYTISPEREDPFTREYALSSSWLATLALDKPSYVVRETVQANLTVTNDGQFGSSLPVELSVPDVNYTRSDRLTVAPGENETVEHTVALPTGLAPGEHRAVVTLGGADPTERVFSFVVPPSSLETEPVSSGPFGPGDEIRLELTNTGGVDTNASCAFALIGSRGVRVDERDVDVSVGAGETVTVNASLPQQVVSGTYFFDATCDDLSTGETTSRTESFAVDGLDADISMSTDKEVYATGENVTVTVGIDNRNDAIENGTLTLEVTDPSADATTNGSGGSAASMTTVDTTATALPVVTESPVMTTTTTFDGTTPTSFTSDDRFTSTSLVDGTTTTRLAATAAAIPASATNITGNVSISNATTWQDRTIVLDGNLSVESGGSLTLRNTSLFFEVDRDYDAGVEVRDGGTLRVLDGSNVSTADRYDDAYFRSLAGSTLELRDSAVGDMGGYGASFLTEGGVVVRTDDALVENATFFQNYYGLIVYNATGVVVRNSTFRQSQDLRLRDVTAVHIEGNEFAAGASTQIEDSDNVTFRANDGVDTGMSIDRSSNVTVSENAYDGSPTGDHISLRSADGNRIEGNDLVGVGIKLYQSDGNTVENNTVRSRRGYGLDIDVSNNNTLRGNEVLASDGGISLTRLQNASLVGNTVNDSTSSGIYLSEALDVTMRDNALVDSNFTVDRGYFSAPPRPIGYYYHDVDTSNTLDGKPVHYLLNETDAVAPTDGGVLYLVNASNVTVAGPNGGSVNVVGSRNVSVRDGVVGNDTYGLFVYNSTGTTGTNLTARDSTEGIHVSVSNRTTLSGNTAENNTDYGIRVIGDYDRLVTGTEIRGNRADGPSGSEAYVFVQHAEGAVVADNDVASARDGGIYVANSPNSTVENNVVSGVSYDGLNVFRSDGSTVSNNDVSGMTFGIEFSQSMDGRVIGNDVTATGGDGLTLEDVDNVTARDNRVRDVTDVGIMVNGAVNGSVAGNDVWNVTQEGIQVRDANGLTVRDNTFTDVGEGSYRGLLPAMSITGQRSYYSRTEQVTIRNNTVVANGTGIAVRKVDVALLDDNDVANTSVGIDLHESYGVTVRNHSFGGGGFNVIGTGIRYYLHDIDGSNTVGGEPVRYLLNETDSTIDGRGLGQVWLVNASDVALRGGGSSAVVRSTNVTVSDLVSTGIRRGVYVYEAANVTVHNATLRNSTIGVSVAASSRVTVRNTTTTGGIYGVYAEANYQQAVNNTTVENSDFSDGTYGIRLVETTNDTIDGSRMTGNQYGIYLDDTEGVEVNGTSASGNEYGVYLSRAGGTLVRHSTVVNGDYGIYLYSTQGSLIYDNYLENPIGTNVVESYTSYSGEPNRWNVSKTPGENILGGPFLGGNYYHDYIGEDLDGDGLGDTDLGSSGFAEGDFHPLVQATDRGSVVWSRNLTVDVADSTTENVTVVVPGSVLSGTSGKLKVSAWLTSTSNQTVAVEDPPFYVFDGDTVLTLEPDARRYKPGETVELTGTLENRGNGSTTYDLSVAANGTERLAETVTLAAGANHTYATNVTVTETGSLDLQASAGGVVVEDRVEVIEPQVEASIVAPTTVGRAPFDAALELENTGRIDAAVDASFLGTDRSLVLEPNETVMLETTTSVDGDTVLEATLTGDVSRTVRQAVDFGEDATVTVAPESVYPEGTVGVPYTVENTGSLDAEFDVTFTLDGRARTRPLYLPAGGTANGTLVYDLGPGNHTLAYETPFGNGSTTVRVEARNQVELTADAAERVENSTLAVNVTLANTGPNDVYGSLRINSTSFDTTREFTVTAGETLNRTVNVTVPEGTAPGTRNLTVEAHTEGERLGRVTDRFALLGAQIELVSGPGVTTYGLGEPASLNVTLENTGNYEGAALLNVTVPGIHEAEQRVFLAPDERRVVPVTFLVPEDLAAGRYPVEYRLDGGPIQETELVVEGMNVTVSGTLNASLYETGDTARLTLDVRNEQSFPVTLFSRVQYNGYDEVRPFDLAADGSTSVAFDVPVREGMDRKVFYSVYAGSGRSLHIDGAYVHRQDPNVTLYTDRQAYGIGDTVTVTVEPSKTGQLDVYAPNFTWSGEVSGRKNLTFTVPELRSGSYNVVYVFANTTRSYPFDVDGYTARVVEASLDSTGYAGGDDVGLALDVEADRSVPVTVTAGVYGEGSTALDESSTSTTLSSGRNQVRLVESLPENASGIHSVVYTIDADRSLPISLATGSEYFDVADSGTNAAPAARFDYTPTVPVAGESVSFDASGSSDSDGSLTSFAWDFDGDLAFDAGGERVTHAFTSAGDYDVTLRVTDDDGRTNVTQRTVTVDAAPATPTPTPAPGTPTPAPSMGGGGGGLPATPVPGIVEVTGGTLLDETVTTGSVVDVEVDLTNEDALHGRITLTLAADGTVVTERTVSVAPSTDRTVLLSHRFDEAGTYTLSVDGIEVGTVTVTEAQSTSPTPTNGPGSAGTPSSPTDTATAAPDAGTPTGTATSTASADSSTPTVATPTAGDGSGFSVLVALLAMSLFALLTRRRRPLE